MFDKNKKIITKKVEGKEDLAPMLVVSIKQVSPKKFRIIILHPNTKKALYEKNHIANDISEAFKIGNEIKASKFNKVKTWYEEILHIPRPKRGKMELKTKKNKKEDKN